MMFHAKYLSSSSFDFLKEDILSFYNINKGKNNDPLGRGQLRPHSFYLNTLGRHPLENISCLYITYIQYITSSYLGFLKEDFF
jgi:hypothetical protein